MKFRRIIQKLIPGRATARMPGFDEIYYCYWYRDIARYTGTPLQHYLQHGWREGRDPSAGFSSDGYLDANEDVRAEGSNPLIHFLNHGLAEGRKGWEKHSKAAPAPRYIPADNSQKLLAPPKPR